LARQELCGRYGSSSRVVGITARIERRRVFGTADQRIPQTNRAGAKYQVSGYGQVLAWRGIVEVI
jgi:hypothetical protein